MITFNTGGEGVRHLPLRLREAVYWPNMEHGQGEVIDPDALPKMLKGDAWRAVKNIKRLVDKFFAKVKYKARPVNRIEISMDDGIKIESGNWLVVYR